MLSSFCTLRVMRASTIAAVLAVVLMGAAAEARGQDYQPSYERIRAGLERAAMTSPTIAIAHRNVAADAPEPTAAARSAATARRNRQQTSGRDSVWNGLLIGAGIGAGGGYLWARNICGSNDAECFAITAPVGVLGGAGIGAAVGALLDALHK